MVTVTSPSPGPYRLLSPVEREPHPFTMLRAVPPPRFSADRDPKIGYRRSIALGDTRGKFYLSVCDIKELPSHRVSKAMLKGGSGSESHHGKDSI